MEWAEVTDAELIERAHAILTACMQGQCSEEEVVVDLIVLFENAGRPFIAGVEIITPAND
jgi:hypothetical protein